MNDVKAIYDELRSLMGKTDEASARRRDEITLWIKEHNTDDDVIAEHNRFMNEGLAAIERDVANLRTQIGDGYTLLPLSYIAKHYFGKSAAWLTQRINGYKVRGQVYTLNEAQKETFNAAVQDIARKIGSVRLV